MNNIAAINNPTKYFLYINRSYKNIDELFVVSQIQLPTQTPVLISDDKEEIYQACERFNAAIKNEMEVYEKDNKYFFLMT